MHSIASSNSSIFDGFSKKRVTPSRIASLAYSKSRYPVSTLTSRSGNCEFNAAIICRPFISGIQISIKTISGLSFSIRFFPSVPSFAVATTRQFQRSHGILLESPSTMIGSSSTSNTLYMHCSPLLFIYQNRRSQRARRF